MKRAFFIGWCLAALLLTGDAAQAQKRCKGTKKWFKGKCRYPDEIKKLRRASRPRPPKRKRRTPSVAGVQWVAIPGGTYRMGSSAGESNEQPVHRVRVRSFSMLKTEVTNIQYRACMNAGGCRPPEWAESGSKYNLITGSGVTKDYYRGYTGGTQPVVGVAWKDARAFCRWAGGRLPSEAEWEHAARSGGRARKFPWGNGAATCSRAVMDDGGNSCGRKHAWPVCSRAAGNSAQGLCDMAGNVWEWTEDCWHKTYHGAPTNGSAWTKNCANTTHVSRGGSWHSTASELRAADRVNFMIDGRGANLGIRCAR